MSTVIEFSIDKETDIKDEWSEVLKEAIQTIIDNKGENIKYFIMEKYFAKYVLLATASSQRHIKSIIEKTLKTLKATGFASKTNVDGINTDWTIIDVPSVDFIINIISEEYLSRYKLLELLQDRDTIRDTREDEE